MWTYTNYHPTVVASKLSLNNPNSRYTMMQTSSSTPGGPSSGRAATPSLFATTGGPTASLDVADLPTHTLYVFLFNGKEFDIKLDTENSDRRDFSRILRAEPFMAPLFLWPGSKLA